MSDLDRYLFDLNGYLVVPGVLDPGMVRRLTDILESDCAAQERQQPGRRDFGVTNLLSLGEELRSLIDHEAMLPYLTEWLGAGFRLDHEYGLVMRPQSGSGGAPHIHGGGVPFTYQAGYGCEHGRIRSRETAISYALTDVAVGEGGMGVIPGSHKANFPLPWAADPGPYPEETVRSVPVTAGSAIIFTEALTHCTRPWRGLGHRRALFYKYTPRNLQVKRHQEDRLAIPGLTERQRAVLEPAGAIPAR